MKRFDLIAHDLWLEPYEKIINQRYTRAIRKEKELLTNQKSLSDFATGYLYFGLHRTANHWVFREWAPNAIAIYILCNRNAWKESEQFALKRIKNHTWEIELPLDLLQHGDFFKLLVKWEGGKAERIPAWCRRVVQDPETLIFSAQVWSPESPYAWTVPEYLVPERAPIVYEAHVGMATEDFRVGTFSEFTQHVIPRIKKAGYNTIQLMAVQEHPYYGSFGYHVSSFFAVSSRFGTPEDLKKLIDTAHQSDIAVIMDLIHSHSVKNEAEGLNRFDGTPYQYFHADNRRNHPAWDSLCFNYGKPEVIHFLLSNCKFWLDEFHFDGFRFDGVTSMLYLDHGLSRDFVNYQMYYDQNEDEDAIVYLTLANILIHELKPDAITVAEEMSGMPGIASPISYGGFGFNYRLAMGTPDYWIKLIKDVPDEQWDIGELFYELSRKRHDEKTIGYAESHDQALVGDKTIVFRLMDKEIYFHMEKKHSNLVVDRALALHKMIRLTTIATAGNGYLNFMGNEFGHPEWIDFPREGNHWSYQYARRQWSLVDNTDLKYHYLGDFDKALINMILRYKTLEDDEIQLLHENKPAQILAFKRGSLVFVLNFNPSESFKDYILDTEPGKYSVVMDTDAPAFGGNGLVDDSMFYYSTYLDDRIMSNNHLKIYIPSRTGLVFRKEPSKSVYDLS